ncbi:MAG: AAA family ATPase [Nitrospinota bacterium]|nr:MAG: AAA family ATPase [Nitrospinota bacterium]
MYYSFFGLKEKPFNVTPDPRFLFLSKQHQEALGHLLYGIEERKGFIEITGEVGTGKTILCRALLNQVGKNVHTALIFNSYLSEIELLQNINTDFGLTGSGRTRKELIDELNRFLIHQFSEGKNAVLIIDEAQNLDPPVLEQIRMLSNLETDSGKLLQIVLVGQPELRDLLSRPNLRQLDQRIAVRYHLQPLDRSDTEQYIYHRLLVAGSRGELEFTQKALDRIHQYSGGIPRRINILCDRALLHAYAVDQKRIDATMVQRAAREVEGQDKVSPPVSSLSPLRISFRWGLVGVMILFLLSAVAAYFFWVSSPPSWSWWRSEAREEQVTSSSPLEESTSLAAPVEPEASPPPPVEARETGTETSSPPLPVEEASVSLGGDEQGEVTASLMPAEETPAPDTLPAEQEYQEKIAQIVMQYGILTPQTVAAGLKVDLFPVWLHFDRLRAFKVPSLVEVFPQDPGQAETFFLLGVRDDTVIAFDSHGEKQRLSRERFNAIWYGKTYLLVPRTQGTQRVLWEGMVGEDVRRLQEDLALLGYYADQPTGEFDTRTKNAVRYFQRDYNLQVDGYVGPETRLMLYYMLGESALNR